MSWIQVLPGCSKSSRAALQTTIVNGSFLSHLENTPETVIDSHFSRIRSSDLSAQAAGKKKTFSKANRNGIVQGCAVPRRASRPQHHVRSEESIFLTR